MKKALVLAMALTLILTGSLFASGTSPGLSPSLTTTPTIDVGMSAGLSVLIAAVEARNATPNLGAVHWCPQAVYPEREIASATATAAETALDAILQASTRSAQTNANDAFEHEIATTRGRSVIDARLCRMESVGAYHPAIVRHETATEATQRTRAVQLKV